MPVPLPPETRILEHAKTLLAAVDFQTIFALPAAPTIRHWRHRHANKSEKPGIALRYVQSEIDNDRGRVLGAEGSEHCWAMTVDIVVDLALLPERTDQTLPAGDTNDATGWDRLLGVARRAGQALIAMDSPFRNTVDDVFYGDTDPDDDSTPDEGRLALAIIVLYRTLYDDPFHLLSPGENA